MEYLGKGLYSIPESARILQTTQQKLRRWIRGYTYNKDNIVHISPPLFKTDYEYDSSDVIISFLDLAELLFIKTFSEYGISIQSIRNAALAASELFNTAHPFAMRKFYTDGKTILARVAEEEKDPALIDLLKKQYQFDQIITPLLYETIDFNTVDEASKYWPLGKGKNIVLDPARNLGKPILDNYNIRTDVIFDLLKKNHSIKEIIDWYEIDELSLRTAIDYEKGLVA